MLELFITPPQATFIISEQPSTNRNKLQHLLNHNTCCACGLCTKQPVILSDDLVHKIKKET